MAHKLKTERVNAGVIAECTGEGCTWSAYKAQQADETYGIELPDTQTLIRRAATYRAKG